MTNSNYVKRSTEKAVSNFENIKAALKGLYEIMELCVSEDDFYREAGKENIEALYKNLIELLLNEYGVRHLVKKINNSEVDLNIELNEYLANA